MSERTYVDEKYYQAVPAGSLAERVLSAARDRMYADFVRLARPSKSDDLLDVGISDVVCGGANLLERLYPRPERISAVGLGEARDFVAAFPAVRYRRIEPHQKLPFGERSFDIACSNAVVEHLGSVAHQRAFVSDLARVGKRVFLTVPNRYFPVEHHTALPLAAWSERSFGLACRALNLSEWADEANLILMDKERLAALCPAGRRMQVGYTGFKLGPFSSNIYLYLDD